MIEFVFDQQPRESENKLRKKKKIEFMFDKYDPFLPDGSTR